MSDLSTERQVLSEKEKRELDIEINFLSGLVERDPCYIEALQLLGDDYTKRGCFDDGLKIDEHLSKLLPDDSMVFYNLACSYSLTDRIDESITALKKGGAIRLRRLQVDGHRPGSKQGANRSTLSVDPSSIDEKAHRLTPGIPR